jgi:peptidoglycan hydrolase-like protein with peptidoglycan-binding domain
MRLAVGVALLALLALAPNALAAQTLGSRVLQEGSRGSDVASLQRLLTRAGFAVPATGDFGAKTKHAVVSFERQYEMSANGVVTRSVVSVLESSVAGASGGGSFAVTASATAPVAAPMLSQGSKGTWVKTLQSDLTYLGYPTAIDGTFGATTKQTVNAFKVAHGFPADGVVGSQTWTALYTAVTQIEDTPTAKARLNPDGSVTPPASAPQVIQKMILAGNQIDTKPYCYGGGHGRWKDSCYDCSGSVSYVLHAAGLLNVSEDSTELESFGARGPGRWVTIWANGGHTYMQIAGLWFDTAQQSSNPLNDRWAKRNIEDNSAFVVRHPNGL